MANLPSSSNGSNGFLKLTTLAIIVLVASLLILPVAELGANQIESESWKSVLRAVVALAAVFAGTSISLLLLEMHAIRQLKQDTTAALGVAVNELETKLRSFVSTALSLHDSGLQAQFPQRREAFKVIAEEARGAAQEIRFLGICNSIFWELPPEVGRENFVKILVDRFVEHGCKLEFIFLDRASRSYPDRERAETGTSGHRLLSQTRVSLNAFVLPAYLEALKCVPDPPTRVRDEFSIREYTLPPTVALTLIDDDMFVAPFIAMICNDVPTQRYSKFTASGAPAEDFAAYRKHLEKHQYAPDSSPIPKDGFLHLCVTDRQFVIDYWTRRAEELRAPYWSPAPGDDAPGPHEQIIEELDGLARTRMDASRHERAPAEGGPPHFMRSQGPDQASAELEESDAPRGARAESSE